MSAQVEIKYFNSFILRKTIEAVDENAVWAGDPTNPDYYPQFPILASSTTAVVDYDWFVEESRIRGEFNSAEIDLGVRAYAKRDEQGFKRSISSIIYSGIFNSNTSTNQSNVFSVSEDITKTLDPRYGSIQMIYADESRLTIFQESKVSAALIDKDEVYSADGKPIQTRTDQVIGEISYYNGDFGIGKFPESFAANNNRRYFADVPNGSVMRLSTDGLTEISKYGMEDYFEDAFKELSTERKRYIVDVSWSIPVLMPTDTITVTGDNIDFIEIGMAVEGIIGFTDLYVIDVGTPSGGSVDITINESIDITVSTQPDVLNLVKYVRDKVIGGYDDVYENYVLSTVYNPPQRTSESGLITITPEYDLEP